MPSEADGVLSSTAINHFSPLVNDLNFKVVSFGQTLRSFNCRLSHWNKKQPVTFRKKGKPEKIRKQMLDRVKETYLNIEAIDLLFAVTP